MDGRTGEEEKCGVSIILVSLLLAKSLTSNFVCSSICHMKGPFSEFRMNLNTSNPLLMATITGGGGFAGANATGGPLDATSAPAMTMMRCSVVHSPPAGPSFIATLIRTPSARTLDHYPRRVRKRISCGGLCWDSLSGLLCCFGCGCHPFHIGRRSASSWELVLSWD